MKLILAAAAMVAAFMLAFAGNASASNPPTPDRTVARCVDRTGPAPYVCRAVVRLDKAGSGFINPGRFSTATWRLTCTRGGETATTVGAINRRGRARVLDWIGKADCTLVARFRSSGGPHAAGAVGLQAG